ncbi:MAG: flagellar biosynthesis protein FlhB [Rhodobacteraceae bacterium]|nr:flagellar biosynthesis protein FlhB [Paracoccaceae bacterium]
MSEDNSEEKTHDASQQKIDKARKKGDIAKSTDVSAAAAYLGLLIAVFFVGAKGIATGASALTIFFSQADQLSPIILGPGGGQMTLSILGKTVGAIAPLFLLPFAAAFLSLLVQQVFIMAPSKIMPKLSRISPIEGFKNKFGKNGLVQFLKTLVKMLAVGTAVGIYLRNNSDEIIGSLRAEPAAVAILMGKTLTDLLVLVCTIAIIIAVVDFMWQKYQHLQKLRMSHKELKDEAKESEGDPHMKSKRRGRAMEIAMNQMMHDVPGADVIVVNPTHYAVALQWSRDPGTAPKCIAKGTDDVARRIREVGVDSGVPIHSDPPTARAIHATIDIGQEIHPDHYRAIAAAIQFAEAMRKKSKERGL